jgi:SAM-dependent methyltransferase
MLEVAPKLLGERPRLTIVDLGCGTGGFLHSFAGAFGGQTSLTGVEISAELVRAGRSRYPEIEFICGDLRDASHLCSDRRFDAVCMLGTHSIFQDVASWLETVVTLIAPHGLGFVLGLFNAEPFDAVIRWRRSPGMEWQDGGYNYWSCLTVANHLKSLQCGFQFKEILFDPDFVDSLPADYPMTFRRATLADGVTRVVNGLQLLCTYYLLTIEPGNRSGGLSSRGKAAARLMRGATAVPALVRRLLSRKKRR